MRKVAVIDDHRVVAELISLALVNEPDLECVGCASSVRDGMALVDRVRPDTVVMDVRLQDGDGIAAAAELTAQFPQLRVVVLSAYIDRALFRRAAAANACALLPKNGDLSELLAALRTGERGGLAVRPELLHRLVGPDELPARRRPSLTHREQEVLQMLAAGLEARVIARELNISVNTFRGYVKSLLSKLGAHSQLEAVAIAMRHGLIHAHART